MRRLMIPLLLAAAAGAAALYRCGPAEGPPFADDLPEDTTLYLATRDAKAVAPRLGALKDVPGVSLFLAHPLSGPVAVLRHGDDWVVLLRGVGSGERDGWHYGPDRGRLVAARSPEALRRFREAPRVRLDVAFAEGDVLAYVVPRAFPSEAWSAWCARWGDFRSISARIDLGADIRITALARYGGSAYRHIVEHALQAPLRAVAPPDVAAWTCQLEHFPRLLTQIDRRLVERGRAHVPLDDFASRLGPAWGAAISSSGEISAAIETRGAPELLPVARRVMADYARANRVELDPDAPQIRGRRAPLRAGEGRIEWGEPPPLWGAGRHHVGTVIDFRALRALDQLPFDREWLDRLRWARRAEAWTRYADPGARVEATISIEEP